MNNFRPQLSPVKHDYLRITSQGTHSLRLMRAEEVPIAIDGNWEQREKISN